MNSYITGGVIKTLREHKGLTQQALADILGVTSKAVSKWETGKGLPDISLIEPLSSALSVSVMELLSGEQIKNKNISANLIRSKFHVCPICGNIIHAVGDAVISCCGISLPPLLAEDIDERHNIKVEKVEDEMFVTISHPMSKTHYISFVAFVGGDKMQFVKLYPEGNAETRINPRGSGYLYFYCNKDGLFKTKISR